ncbi:serpin B3 [Mesoplodon densirostris]|uniref:serpin B3 n=1 Tax=Mesoplodon densirostris TaxID=48708 RepID=UPI0028DB58BD|nr:serpin B3 [Mesoplodon densirostris]XP_059974991.1 serpin B3 [Mesoplodon densirostris]XP_059974992.1 serpin B3 [Mesoplodon densirostris]
MGGGKRELYSPDLTIHSTSAHRLSAHLCFLQAHRSSRLHRATMSSLGEAIIHFAVDLFQQIRQSEKENIFFSPLSIMSALAMTSLGAQGHTASEILKVLHSNENAEDTIGGGATRDPVEKPGDMHHQFQNLLTEFKKPTDAYELNIANRLYGAKPLLFLQAYMDNIEKFYLASVESADFVSAAEESRKMINSWVESQTNEKIKDLFPEGTLGSTTILVLVNAVYFKGQWCQEFKKENTGEEKFWLNKDTSKSVQMMKQTSHFNFTSLEDMQVKILEIPYKGQELSMMVLLPNDVDGLQKLEDQLTAEKLIEWTSPQNMKELQVDLYLPRFKVEESYSLKPTLIALGMVDAFSLGKADFSGMTGGQGLVLSKVLHKSFVEVNEEGTEAAASTGVEVRLTSRPTTDSFRCDHPFLFFIKHNKTNSLLFYGRVSSPEM